MWPGPNWNHLQFPIKVYTNCKHSLNTLSRNFAISKNSVAPSTPFIPIKPWLYWVLQKLSKIFSYNYFHLSKKFIKNFYKHRGGSWNRVHCTTVSCPPLVINLKKRATFIELLIILWATYLQWWKSSCLWTKREFFIWNFFKYTWS